MKRSRRGLQGIGVWFLMLALMASGPAGFAQGDADGAAPEDLPMDADVLEGGGAIDAVESAPDVVGEAPPDTRVDANKPAAQPAQIAPAEKAKARQAVRKAKHKKAKAARKIVKKQKQKHKKAARKVKNG